MSPNASQSRRRKIIRAIILCLAGPPLLLLAVRLLWGLEATHRLAAVNASLRARGIRLDPPQVQVPDDQNAALAIIQAIQAIKLTSAEDDLLTEGDKSDNKDGFTGITWTDAHLPAVRAILARNDAVFHWLRVAEERPAAHWPVSAAGFQLPPGHPLYKDRLLADLLFDAALAAHLDHHEREALEDLSAILTLARTVDQDPAELSHLVALAIRAVAAGGVERFNLELHLTQSDGSIDAARGLLTALQEASQDRGERAIAFENEIGLAMVSPEPGMQPFWQWWFQPLFLDETARTKHAKAEDIASLRADNWSDANAMIPRNHRDIDTLLQASTLFESNQEAGLSWKYSQLHFRSRAACGASAMLLAAALYNTAFSHLPANAPELVPNFLPALPIDPFAVDHRPMAYRLDPAGPTVWSVGDNGTDEGGHVFYDADGELRPRYGGSSNPKHNPPDLIFGAAWTTAPAKAPSATSK